MQGHPNAQAVFFKSITDHLDVVKAMTVQQELLERIALAMVQAVAAGKKILWCGNGAGAAASQLLAAEIVGRFRRERRGLPSLALTSDSSILTAVANVYGFDSVFSRQIEAIGQPGDVLVGLSTTGNCRNVVAAFKAARARNLVTVAFTGGDGGELADLADYLIAIPSKDDARIQEAHILAGHMLCDWIELDYLHSQAPTAELPPAAGAGLK